MCFVAVWWLCLLVVFCDCFVVISVPVFCSLDVFRLSIPSIRNWNSVMHFVFVRLNQFCASLYRTMSGYTESHWLILCSPLEHNKTLKTIQWNAEHPTPFLSKLAQLHCVVSHFKAMGQSVNGKAHLGMRQRQNKPWVMVSTNSDEGNNKSSNRRARGSWQTLLTMFCTLG